MPSGLFGDWDKLANILNPVTMQKQLDQAQKRVGVYATSEVKKGIRSGSPGGNAFTPNTKFTVNQKGSSKPLIHHGDLIGSITHEEPDDKTVWVGVRKGAKGKNGSDMIDIAHVHEFGKTIAVTPKMRVFLHHKGLHLNPKTSHIRIPERSFLRATLNAESFKDGIVNIYIEKLRKHFLP